MSNYGLPYCLRLAGADGSSGSLNVALGILQWNGVAVGSGGGGGGGLLTDVTVSYGGADCAQDLSALGPGASVEIFHMDPTAVSLQPNSAYLLNLTFNFQNAVTTPETIPGDGVPFIGLLSFDTQLGEDGGLYSSGCLYAVDMQASGAASGYAQYQFAFATDASAINSHLPTVYITNLSSCVLSIQAGDPQLVNAQLTLMGPATADTDIMVPS